jgi:hypothetical protein
MSSLSQHILSFLLPFSVLFSRPVWHNALVLLIGTLLCRGKRTVCAALRIMGLDHDTSFAKYHHVLNRVKWSSLAAAQILFKMILPLIDSLGLVLFIDETLERRKGPKIKAKGYYRDAVRSSKSITVKSSGLKWLVLSAALKFPFSSRYFALPFMTVLQPSVKADAKSNRRHKTTLDWTRQMLMQVLRWGISLPITLVGDGGFATGALAWFCLKHRICLISRLKMNAQLYDFAPVESQKKRGRKKTKGNKLVSFKEMLTIPDLPWQEAVIPCYGGKTKRLRYIHNTNLWGGDGFQPVPIKWVLVIDPEGELDPIPLMCTDFTLSAERIITLFIQRWNLEVTFEEVREHLGVETQRQWSDKAIARTTPVLLGLYTIVCLIANRLQQEHPIEVAQTAWYEKNEATFSDLLKAVRKILWRDNLISWKRIFESFRENKKDLHEVISAEGDENTPESTWIRVLIEHLAAA